MAIAPVQQGSAVNQHEGTTNTPAVKNKLDTQPTTQPDKVDISPSAKQGPTGNSGKGSGPGETDHQGNGQ